MGNMTLNRRASRARLELEAPLLEGNDDDDDDNSDTHQNIVSADNGVPESDGERKTTRPAYPHDPEVGPAPATTPRVRMTARVGTTLFMAPEIMKGGDYSKKIDVWSYGAMLSELLTLEQPYPEDLRMMEIMKGVLTHTLRPRVPRPDEVPHPDLAALVAACVRSRPGARPSFVEIERRLQVVLREIE